MPAFPVLWRLTDQLFQNTNSTFILGQIDLTLKKKFLAFLRLFCELLQNSFKNYPLLTVENKLFKIKWPGWGNLNKPVDHATYKAIKSSK